MAELCISTDSSIDDSKSFSRKSETDTKRLCEPCLFDKTEQEVAAFCTVCTEFLCKDCTRDHKKNKVTRIHCILEGKDVPSDSKAFKMMKKMTSCSKHPDVVVTYKCEDHNNFICITCLAVEHRKCEHVSEICALGNGEVKNDDVSELQQKRRELWQWTTAIKSVKEETIKCLFSEQNRLKTERTQFVNSIIEQLHEMDERCKIETEQLVSKEVAVLQESVIKLNIAKVEQEVEDSLIDTTLRFGNKTETSVILSLLLKKTETLETEYNEHSDVKHVQLNFERNESLAQIKSLGKVNVVSVDAHKDVLRRKEAQLEKASDEVIQSSSESSLKCTDDQKPSDKKRKNLVETSTTQVPLIQRLVSSVILHPIRNETDRRTCSVLGSVLLPNDQIVIIDSNNRKIKVFNSNISFVSELRLDGTPIDICYIKQSRIALLFDYEKSVKVYLIDTGKVLFERSRSQMINLYGMSISHYKDWDALILCSNIPHSSPEQFLEIQIRNLWDGRKITISVDHLLEKSLCNTYCVHCVNGNELYITHNQKFTCFKILSKFSDLKLIEKWFYKNHRHVLENATDITSDSEGNIYVCGKSSGNVHQVCGTNFWINRLIVSKITVPMTVLVNGRKGEIIVGCENDGNLHVYNIKG